MKRLVLDHVTFSWGADEVVSLCRSQYVTVEWCTVEEGAIKEGGSNKYRGYHYFAIFSAYNVEGDFISVHHNLIAHNSRGCPTARDGFADLRNNVVYNARGGFDLDGSCAKTGASHDYNFIGNYFKRGPNSTGELAGVSWGKRTWWAEWRNETRPDRGTSKYFVEDNLWDDQPPPLPAFIEDGTGRLKKPMPAPAVTTQKAKEAYELVLKRAGAWPRDAVTRRTIEEVRNGTGDYGRPEPKGGLMEGLTPTNRHEIAGLPRSSEHRMLRRLPKSSLSEYRLSMPPQLVMHLYRQQKSHEPFVWIREIHGLPYPSTNCASGKSASEYSFSHLMHLAASLPFNVKSPPQLGHGCGIGRFQLVKSTTLDRRSYSSSSRRRCARAWSSSPRCRRCRTAGTSRPLSPETAQCNGSSGNRCSR